MIQMIASVFIALIIFRGSLHCRACYMTGTTSLSRYICCCIYRQNYSMSRLCLSVLLCTMILPPLTASYSGSESGDESLNPSEDTVSKMEREDTYNVPYWNMWSSDFYGWMEELRAQGAYDTLLDLARTYWAHFPLYNYLGDDSNAYPGESEDTGN